ncbi:hypothetical protein PHYBLDRAFT_163528 [Phycomyces blakesleeanus NRRL 1555(-)]|uniref:Uncharacterized protein n=1 Tax=Phycomyces blakesleeanus (strain ATCC 8743b / DSM 1359 / FGSC 10004 / NBRC 33097 / NRRL 1555) TaxID=763407 RepID=A0A167PRQ7_PHYB8|nr:hypothetical protein PHYBLDRAFT_163528 [Phycomyces blakesleeanus NRRL 1555(-)]OAD78414.1 hypothetical protein PHYBLDRAFT_163528 [Phycomyces blakesleeanus NRRL 1555(-)]|eukprot:XP_018296454.1 hypothetical protein PHYBLDRAFT_163528 [Phycomyces blakesleeanus NRRL 1555(-)]
MFENLIRSNRLLTYLLFYRRKSLKKEIELKSEHLDIEEVRLIYKLLSLNSCRKSVFMARQRTPEIIAHILTNGGSEYYRNMRRNKNKKKKKKYMEVYRWQKYESQKKRVASVFLMSLKQPGHPVLRTLVFCRVCNVTRCVRVSQRNLNAVINMITIPKSVWPGEEGHEVFNR